MKILLVTQWCHPESPDVRSSQFAKALLERGHEVEILTGFPNYPEGRLYPGYKMKPWMRENINGVPVIRVPLYPSHDRSAAKRILNYVSFAFFSAALGPFLVKKPDVMYVMLSPATTGLTALALKYFRRVPYVLDIQDLWPDSVVHSGMFHWPMAISLLDKWCSLIYRQAARITVISEGFKSTLVSRGVAPEKIDVIYNWCGDIGVQANDASDEPASGSLFGGKFTVLFAGTMGTVQALDHVIGAAELLRHESPPVQFAFVGGGVDADRLKAEAIRLGLDNALFFPRVPIREIMKYMRSADAMLAHLQDSPVFAVTIPSKTPSYLKVGKPIIMAVRGESGEIIEKAKAGIACKPESKEEIAKAALALARKPAHELKQMGQNGMRYYQERMSIETGVKLFEDVFSRAIQSKNS